ncbi:MAG: hypothetical protein KF865_02545 [Bdellovibrionaceae bacterium]|nr:hypothetical protein [Pseudobdellovibrionaceae bacterium]
MWRRFFQRRMSLSVDAFSDGQIASKLWLCRELERLLESEDWKGRAPFLMTVYAGWAGLLPFLIFSRERIPVEKIELLDLDPAAVENSLRINDHWRIQGRYEARVRDINGHRPAVAENSIIFNTSCEHLKDSSWWEKIPPGALVVLQGTDMPHHEHVRLFRDLGEFKSAFSPLRRVWFEGVKEFRYPQLSFSRFLLIAEKGP